jgi:hypothetical protein
MRVTSEMTLKTTRLEEVQADYKNAKFCYRQFGQIAFSDGHQKNLEMTKFY